jgi:small multidrug resistance family-3 protein
MQVLLSLTVFLIAGLAEIGGGYCMWLWLREGRSPWLGLAGAIILALYGLIATVQPVHFGRAYAAYGGIFVLLSLFWGAQIDGVRLQVQDLVGAALSVLGAVVIMFWPRG